MRTLDTRRVLACVFLAIGALAIQPSAAQYEGRMTYGKPVPSERGDWTGTWFHIERDKKVAVWIRQDGDGPPRVKLQYFSTMGDEQFRTDWNSRAEYEAKGTTGYFDMRIVEGDENRMRAEWDWKLEFPDSGRSEKSAVEIFRTGDGRGLAFVFEDWVQTIRRGSHLQNIPAPHAWTFRKISKRELIWDELPI